MSTYEWITTFLGPVCGLAGWIAGRRLRRNETIRALQTTIDLLVQKNKELYDELMELRKENDALKDEGIRRDNRISELEREIENLKK